MLKEIFGVDRADDWQRFFQKHVEIEEPLLADAEMEARLEQSDGSLFYFLAHFILECKSNQIDVSFCK